MSTDAPPTPPTDPIEVYVRNAREAGCPPDQIERFLAAGVVLHPKQLIASAAARLCDLRCPRCQALHDRGARPVPDCPDCGPTAIGYGGARSGGKSYWLVSQIGIDDCQRYEGLKALILRKIGKANRENIGELAANAFRSVPYKHRERESILEFEGSGSRIVMGHFKDEGDIDQYIGLEYDVIGIEESTTLSDQKKLNILGSLRTSKKGWRPRIYETTNPGGISHQSFKKKYVIPFRNKNETRTRFIPATVYDNPSVNPEYITDVLEKYTGWQGRAWREGDWDIEQGQYFVNFDHPTHVLPSDGFERATTWDVWCSLDYGLTHYTVVHLFARTDDGDVIVLDEHSERGWVPEQHAEAVKAMLARWSLSVGDLKYFVSGADTFNRRVMGDEIGTIADQYMQHGITLTRANIDRVNGAAEIYRRLGNPRAKGTDAYIRPTLFFLDRCRGLIETLPAMQRSKLNPEDVQKVDCDPDTGEGGDDFVDCMRYGLMQYSAHRPASSAPSMAGPRRDFADYKPR
jgi:phage terminase large subunit